MTIRVVLEALKLFFLGLPGGGLSTATLYMKRPGHGLFEVELPCNEGILVLI